MEYIELRVKKLLPDQKDLLTFYLAEEGFESFTEEGEDLLAYVQSALYQKDKTSKILEGLKAEYDEKIIPDQNWNEEWEKNFQPVTINGRCHIRAPFHPELKDIQYEIVIMPKMSFGTAHHETTAGMIELMMDLDLKGKTVLDMGCGTAILAILAEKMGAANIVAIDNDHWAYENALENAERNNCSRITVKEGGKELITGNFDVIIANINRNILLDQMNNYSSAAKNGSLLLMSGFYEEDLSAIKESARENGFSYKMHQSQNNWVAALFNK
ncbi:MAG: 50S ribosomal protein L11 methyltransferase [Syntrophothermus sp.]